MTLSEINPFVRFASEFDFSPRKRYCVTPDYRIFFICSGSGKIIIEHTCYDFSNSSLIYIPCGFPYKFIAEETIRLIAVNFDFDQQHSSQTSPIEPELFDDVVKIPERNLDYFTECEPLNNPLFLKDGSKISDIIKTLINENLKKELHYSEKMSSILKTFVVDMVRSHTRSTYSSKTENKLSQAINYIHENYKNDINNQSVAKEVGYHPYHLNRMFDAYVDMSMHRYINNYRITISEHLLISTNLSVTEIATAVGFNNTIRFTENFKKKNKLTPSKYRSEYKL